MRALWPSLSFLVASCASVPPPAPAPSQIAQQFDLIVRGGTIVDGSGGQPFTGDVGISGDRIVAVAPHLDGMATRTIDATGLAVAPGFVNMLSWANDSLIEDGAGESDIRQGVTLEVMGEGDSEGPYNDELIAIAKASGGPAEIYHMKQAGTGNWDKQKPMIDRIEAARAQGIRITADMYTYTAGATGLDAAMPPWVRAGGYDQWRKRLLDPVLRKKVVAEMKRRPVGWDSFYFQAGSPDKVLFLQFKNPALKKYTGMTLTEVAKARGTSPEDAAIDLVIEDGTRVGTAYFLMSEDNVARQTALPWMSFGSDAGSQAPRGKFLLSSVHPRTYGTFARLLGKYVRDEHRLSLAEAVRKLSYQPTSNLGITDRGLIRPGMHADLAIFDPAKIADTATYDKPQQFAVGMRDVLVNGQPVLLDGEMTPARPGRAVTGPGTGTGTGRCPPK